jgi:general secretion pathway protein J
MMLRARHASRSAMTLIEVMVAIAVLGIIAALTGMTISGTLKAREALSYNDDMQQSARVALNTITRELQLGYLTYNRSTPNTYRTVFVGKDNDPVDELWFATLAHQRLYRNAKECDQAEITIWAEPDPYMDGHYVLMHRESPRIDHEPDQDGTIYPLAYGVRQFIVRYLDAKRCMWVEEWDSVNGEESMLDEVPRAAQVVLSLSSIDPDDEDEFIEHTFATTVILQYGPRATCDLFPGVGEGETNASEEDPRTGQPSLGAGGGSRGPISAPGGSR